MNRTAALCKTAATLQTTSSHVGLLQLALQRCQMRSAVRAFSDKADDAEGDKASPVSRGSWREWVEQQLSGIDKAALSEEQQAAARQLQSQQPQQANVQDQLQAEQSPDQPPAQSPDQPPADAQIPQQSAQAAAAAEEEAPDTPQASAASQLESPSDKTSPTQDLEMPAGTPHPTVLEQPVSELSAAAPAEPSEQSQQTMPAVHTPPAPDLNDLSNLSVDERVDIFLQAIRNRSWEQTIGQPVVQADADAYGLRLPPSGYTELGAVSQGRSQGQMLNPSRTFYPGQSYDPEDLLPSGTASVRRAPVQTVSPSRQALTNKQVLTQADFRNVSFLNSFVSDGGQIEARSKTGLQAKVHRHLARQIKTARVMALLPHSGRADEFRDTSHELSDDDFAADGEIDDSRPNYSRIMQQQQNDY